MSDERERVEEIRVYYAAAPWRPSEHVRVLLARIDALEAEVERLRLERDEAQVALAALQVLVKRLRADSERLDWLETTAGVKIDASQWDFRDHWQRGEPRTLRLAIDAAMEAEREGEGEGA